MAGVYDVTKKVNDKRRENRQQNKEASISAKNFHDLKGPKVLSQQGKDNWDRIFGNKDEDTKG